MVIEELRSLVGKGKRFESDAALANFCEVDAAFVHKHLRGKVKGDKIRPLLDFLNKAGVNMTLGGQNLPVMAVAGAGPGQFAAAYAAVEYLTD